MNRYFLIPLLLSMTITFNKTEGSENTDGLALSSGNINISIPAIFSLSDSSSCIIPFTRAGNLIMFQARADTTTGNFILDTGAPHLVLNITYFRNYPVNEIHDADQTSITGNTPTVSRTMVNDFSFGSLQFNRLDAD